LFRDSVGAGEVRQVFYDYRTAFLEFLPYVRKYVGLTF
jgi:hypothetical protein